MVEGINLNYLGTCKQELCGGLIIVGRWKVHVCVVVSEESKSVHE
jgi:hypothetical protein